MNGVIAWFAGNRVAANLLMVFILAGGIITIGTVKKEVFPELESNLITITVPYLGAAPEEVEEAVCVRIEEAIQGLEGIEELTSNAAEGVGTVTVEVDLDFDTRELLDDIKNRVDAIDTFPAETEKPIIQEVLLRRQVTNIAIHGDLDERSLKNLGERVRDELAAMPGISQTDLVGARPYEIAIEVSEEDLRRHGLTFDEVARAVRESSLDLPGGSVRTSGGEILLRSKGQAYRGRQFEDLVLLTRADGTYLRLGDVAHVVDGFAETDQVSRFDGQPSVMVRVYRVGDQNALEIAETVKGYVDQAQARAPEGVHFTIWQDDSVVLRSRMDLLIRNGLTGFILVFASLALFLRFRLAGWVTLGIPVSFFGAIWLMPTLAVSINLISLFAFIVVLGIVVDDAIVVGESIYTQQSIHGRGLKAAVTGTQEVAKPVIFAVLTSVVAFLPLLFVESNTGRVMRVIPLMVIPTLLFSLVESIMILPAHLSHARRRGVKHGGDGEKSGEGEGRGTSRWRRFQGLFSNRLEWFIHKVYQPFLEQAIQWRYLTLAVGVATLALTVGLVGGNWIQFSFFPPVEADNVAAFLTMPQGTPVEVTSEAVDRIESAALELREELNGEDGPGAFLHMSSAIGDQPFRSRQSRSGGNSATSFSGAHLGEVTLALAPAEERSIRGTEIARLWREKVGAIPDAVELTYTSNLFGSGEPVNIRLTSGNFAHLQEAAHRLKDELAKYSALFDISDTFRKGKEEVKLAIKPEAETLGLSLSDLARQVRQGFYGEEAQRIQRGRDDIRVMVRYPAEERRSLGDLESMRIRTADGSAVPFSTVAHAELGRGYATITRSDRRRAVNVTADVDLSRGNANVILAELEAKVLPGLLADYPGMLYSLEGQQKQQQETMSSLARGFALALLLMFALLAIPLKSYLQPLIIMSAIPFGLVGAIWGHVIMGMQLTILSMFGIVALAGVVVNDSLVLVDFINRIRAKGIPMHDAARKAGAVRFRAILLTSITTFLGLSPLMLERSLQAQFLIPMAISLAFGVIFSTVITLLLVPAGYLILEDILHLYQRMTGRLPEPEGGAEGSSSPLAAPPAAAKGSS